MSRRPRRSTTKLSGDGGLTPYAEIKTWLGRRVNSTWKAQYEVGAAVFGSCGRQGSTNRLSTTAGP
jgi:hypothetical protein